VPILVDDAVMDRAGVRFDGEGEGDEEGVAAPLEERTATRVDEERLSVFRDFIDTLDLDDFGKKSSS
jgi:hypothetical protein